MKVSTIAVSLFLFATVGFVVVVDAAGYDAAFIHPGCSSPNHPEFYDDEDCNNLYNTTTGCAFGEGWYCNDGKDVSGLTSFDNAKIHKDCGAGVHYLGGSGFVGAMTWYCADDGPLGWVEPSFIHGDCQTPSTAMFAYDSDCDGGCAFGTGWYCNDGKDVSGYANPYDFDAAFIGEGCSDNCGDGQCVEWYGDIGAWLCKDGGLDALKSNTSDKSAGGGGGGGRYWRWLGPVLAVLAIAAIGVAVWMAKFRNSGEVQEAVPVAATPIARVKGDDGSSSNGSGDEESAQQARPVVVAPVVSEV